MMTQPNLLHEAFEKINALEQSVKVQRENLAKDSNELDAMKNELDALQSKYEMKKLSVSQLAKKIEDKNKIITEARKSYNKIVENTTKLLQGLNLSEEK